MTWGRRQHYLFGKAGGVATPPPTAPSNLVAATNYDAHASVTLTWDDNSSDETGFIISKSTDNVSYTDIHTTAANATSYTVSSGLNYDELTYFKVRATGAGGPSAPTAAASAYPRFHPSAITANFALWETRTGITGASNASRLADQSANGLDLIQNTGAAQPAVSTNVAAINNRTALVGDGTRHMATDPTDPQHAAVFDVGNGDFAMLLLVRLTNTANRIPCGRDTFAGGNYAGTFFQYNASVANKCEFAIRNNASTIHVLVANNTTTQAWHMLTGTRRGQVQELKVDDVSEGTATSANIDSCNITPDSTVPFKLLTADQLLNFRHDNGAAACCWINGTTTSAQMTGMFNRWRAYYGWM